MKLDTARFGEIDYNEASLINFPEGLPGLESEKKFIFVHTEDTEPVFWIQSVTDTSLALPVLHIFDIDGEYALDISDEDVDLLQVKAPEELMVLAVVTIPGEVQNMTANFAAPLLIHSQKLIGKQVFISDANYSVRKPVFEAVIALIERRAADAGIIEESE